MKIIISPAKKMNVDTDSFDAKGLPEYLSETVVVMQAVQRLSLDESKRLWKCNDKLAELNYERFKNMNLCSGLTPAVFSYEGLQYQHMAPRVFTERALEYIQRHLRILSGFYGILKPFDGVVPYRLEMQAKLGVDGKKDLYEFWGSRLYDSLTKSRGGSEKMCGGNIIINLASKEYFKAIEPYIKPCDRIITVDFLEETDSGLKSKGTLAKMARGEMVRFMAENCIEDIEQIKNFDVMNFRYREELSDISKFVFVLCRS